MRINRLATAVAAAVTLVIGAGSVHAQTATQVVTFKVVAANRMAFGSASASVSVQRPSASAAPTSASVAGSSYGITTNEVNQKISASINAPLPAGETLAVSLAAPAGATSKGMKTLSTQPADVVTGISAVNADALPVTYQVTGNARGARVVTYTITAGL